jgi:hypothetical protein
VRIEWNWAATAYNLRKLSRAMADPDSIGTADGRLPRMNGQRSRMERKNRGGKEIRDRVRSNSTKIIGSAIIFGIVARRVMPRRQSAATIKSTGPAPGFNLPVLGSRFPTASPLQCRRDDRLAYLFLEFA